MFFTRTISFIVSLFLVVLTQGSYAWGAHGHNITAELAYGLLTPATIQRLHRDFNIRTMEEFRRIANYADEIKSHHEYAWSYELHYTDVDAVPRTRCVLNLTMDCVGDRCVVGAVRNYTQRLGNGSEIDDLWFLVHFIGDIFQPFHMGYASDRGGNTIHVIYPSAESHLETKHTNLHAVWDTHMIEQAVLETGGGDVEEFVRTIPIHHYTNHFNTAEEVGNDSLGLLCSRRLYMDGGILLKDGATLSPEYYNTNIQTVIDQLAYSAHYMAYVLNEWGESAACIGRFF